MTTYLACIGARSDIIGMAALHRVLQARGDRMLVLHTGQQQAMTDLLLRFFGMDPYLQMPWQRETTRRGGLPTADLVNIVGRVIGQSKADVVLVQGDKRSALVGALAAEQYERPVAHVEAGLRSTDPESYSEEHQRPNQAVIDGLARWHFATTEHTRDQLLHDGIPRERVHMVGNPVIDTALWVRQHLACPGSDAAGAVPLPLRQFLRAHPATRLLLVTAESLDPWGQPIRNIADAVGQLLFQQPDLIVVWPLEADATVRAEVERRFDGFSPGCRQRICVTDPLDYPALISVLAQCHITLTTSGGSQREASALARPVLIARDGAEREELVEAGGARWVGTQTERIVDETVRLLTQYTLYRSMQLSACPFGDGQSASRIADILSA
jgi:UDP-N-acetylglucosamine 2-epimerase (non-hydrolysing)